MILKWNSIISVMGVSIFTGYASFSTTFSKVLTYEMNASISFLRTPATFTFSSIGSCTLRLGHTGGKAIVGIVRIAHSLCKSIGSLEHKPDKSAAFSIHISEVWSSDSSTHPVAHRGTTAQPLALMNADWCRESLDTPNPNRGFLHRESLDIHKTVLLHRESLDVH